MSSKLNDLLKKVTPGAFVLQSWLTEQGISRQLANKYVQSGWLNRVSSGVYVRPGKLASWFDAVAAVSQQTDVSISLAGLSSLTYQGRAHYLTFNEKEVWLSTESKAKLPLWLKNFSQLESPDLDPKQPALNFVQYNAFDNVSDADFIDVDVNGVKVKASRPELAAFELLELVPNQISFEHAAHLFEGLVNLSPRKVQSILERSHAVKTNRLYLFLAHYYNHDWLKRVDESKVRLGAGMRQIITGGKVDKAYQITVPQNFMNLESANG